MQSEGARLSVQDHQFDTGVLEPDNSGESLLEGYRSGDAFLGANKEQVTWDQKRWMVINLLLVSICYCLGCMVSFGHVSITSVAAKSISTNTLSTIPFSIEISISSLTLPLSGLVINRFGYKAAFIIGALTASVGTVISGLSFYLNSGSFPLLCFSMVVQGLGYGMIQFYRHVAASDFTIPQYSSYAISVVVLFGIIAAFVGPEIALRCVNLIPEHPFSGSYFIMSGINVVHAVAVLFISFPKSSLPKGDELQGLTNSSSQKIIRPLRVIVKDPNFIKAVTSAAIIHLTMLGLMTVTPVIISDKHGQLSMSTAVIQSHLIGMFVPSILTGVLIAKFGTSLVIGIGLSISILFQLSFLFTPLNSIFYFVSLAGIGLGWNFGFIGATTLLSTVYQPEERVKVQTLNDFLVFGFGGVITLCSGYLYGGIGTTNTIYFFSIALTVVYLLFLGISGRQYC